MAKQPKQNPKAKSQSKAKQSDSKLSLKAVLGKRVGTAGEGKLGRDVKMPRWMRAIGGYFKGSYEELRQVRWPNRRAAWGLTFGVIIFTLTIAVVLLLLDFVFEIIFKQVIL